MAPFGSANTLEISQDMFIYLLPHLFLLAGSLKKGRHEIVIKRHAFERAMQRRIHPDLVEDTPQSGKMKIFGKNRVKF